MIDIQGELLQRKQQRDQKYISITELLDFIKKYNPNSSFQDIATYLLIKLAPNDIRKTDEDIWGDEQYDFWQEQNGIAVFNIPKSIDEKETYIHPNFFFEALETVRDNPEGVSFHEGWEFAEEARIYLKKGQQDIYIDRARIEKLLSIDTLTQHEQYKPTEINNTHNESAEINKLNARITELENTHIDTEKDSIIAQLQLENAELQTRISELENKVQQSAVDSKSVLGNAKATRISKIQRDIFTLLVLKNYQGLESRNALFDVINAALKEEGINNKGASYQTFDNLIDENIRLTKIGLDGKQTSHSPFPSKIIK